MVRFLDLQLVSPLQLAGRRNCEVKARKVDSDRPGLARRLDDGFFDGQTHENSGSGRVTT
jgi:hypothetical protein